MLTKATKSRHLLTVIYALCPNYYQRVLYLIADYLIMGTITIYQITVIKGLIHEHQALTLMANDGL